MIYFMELSNGTFVTRLLCWLCDGCRSVVDTFQDAWRVIQEPRRRHMSHRTRRESRPDSARVARHRSGETGAAWQRQRVRDTSLDDRNARRAQVDQLRAPTSPDRLW